MHSLEMQLDTHRPVEGPYFLHATVVSGLATMWYDAKFEPFLLKNINPLRCWLRKNVGLTPQECAELYIELTMYCNIEACESTHHAMRTTDRTLRTLYYQLWHEVNVALYGTAQHRWVACPVVAL